MAKKGQKYPGKPGQKVPRGISKILKESKAQAKNTGEWDED